MIGLEKKSTAAVARRNSPGPKGNAMGVSGWTKEESIMQS